MVNNGKTYSIRRVIVLVVAVLLAIVASVLLLGTLLPRTHSVTVSMELQVPAESVFGLIVSIDEWSQWRSDVDDVRHSTDGTFVATVIDGDDLLDFEFDVDFEHKLMTSTILTNEIPFGGEWVISVVESGPLESIVTVTENGFVDPFVWRFASYYIIGQTSSIDRFLGDVERACANVDCDIR